MPGATNFIEPHEPHWVVRAAFPFLSVSVFAMQVALGFAAYHGWFWLAVPLVLIAGHLMHGMLIAFHEASHGLLRKSRFMNDLDGVLIGTFSFMSFTVYRVLHQTHHMHLSSPRDEEFWPFVCPEAPRWARRLAALVELNAGLIFTPLLFARSFLRAGSPIRSPKIRRRVWAEWALIAVVWTGVLSAVAVFGVWKYFFWIYLAPALLAGNLQSWRKYVEHMGMTGSTPNSATRTIIAEGWLGKLVAFTLLHEPYHGVHHQHAGVPHAKLPQLTASVAPRHPGDQPPYPSYRQALVDVIRGLADPRVGPQWMAAEGGSVRSL